MIVRKLRDKNKWSQEQLAQMAGISLRTIQRVEAGNSASIETLKALASVFEVEVSKLTEEISVLDKTSKDWLEEPWFIKLTLFGIKRRSHLLMLELIMITVGLLMLFRPDAPAYSSALAIFCAYLNAKIVAYIDSKGYW